MVNTHKGTKTKMAKSWNTWTNDKSASRTLSLLNTGLFGVELEIGVRERGGLGGGKGWSTGVPYWRGRFRECWTAALGCTDEEIGGTNSEDEDVDAKNVEGLTRLMIWLPLLAVSRESRGKPDIDEVEWEADGICTVGAVDNKPPGAEVTVAECCLKFSILEA